MNGGMASKSPGGPWDCAVIGAGPAGTMAARHAALLGLRTVLIEKHSFPRGKVCGACLNHRALQWMSSTGLTKLIDDLGGKKIDSFFLRGFGAEFQRELPGGNRGIARPFRSGVDAVCLQRGSQRVELSLRKSVAD